MKVIKTLDEEWKHEEKATLTKVKIWAYRVVGAMSAIAVIQGWYISRENSVIMHRLDVRDAYFTKGLIDGAKEREAAFISEREQNLQILEHCKINNKCDLPPTLAVTNVYPAFESIEKILTKE